MYFIAMNFSDESSRGHLHRVWSIKILYTGLKKRRSDASRWYSKSTWTQTAYTLKPVRIKDKHDKYLNKIRMNNLRRWTGRRSWLPVIKEIEINSSLILVASAWQEMKKKLNIRAFMLHHKISNLLRSKSLKILNAWKFTFFLLVQCRSHARRKFFFCISKPIADIQPTHFFLLPSQNFWLFQQEVLLGQQKNLYVVYQQSVC